jgi:hypothetical protein
MLSNENVELFTTPATVRDWCAATRQGEGNLAGVELGADLIPDARLVPIQPEALALFRAYERDVIRAQNELEREGLAELEGRSREKALRLSEQHAGAESPLEPAVRARNAEWAIDYVRHYTAQTIQAVRERMTTGKFGRWCSLALRQLRLNENAGTLLAERGQTWAEISKGSRELQDLDDKQAASVLTSLHGKELIYRLPDSPGKRGRPRAAAFRIMPTDSAD